MEVEPLKEGLAARIHGLDLTKKLSDSVIGDIAETLYKAPYPMLYFGSHELEPQNLIDFGACFGEVKENTSYSPSLEGYEQIIVVERDSFFEWHIESSYNPVPPAISILYGEILYRGAGETLFCSQYDAYDALSPAMAAYLDGLVSVHDGGKVISTLIRQGKFPQAERYKSRRGRPYIDTLREPAEHPIVKTHPVSKRKSLYFNPGYTNYIKNIPQAESDSIVAFLYGHVAQEKNTYRHRWSQGDVVLWDNHCTLHRGAPSSGSGRRRLLQTTVF